MAERPIDELKIKISVDESGDVAKSLENIVSKLDKINEAGKGANTFADLLATLSNMDKSLSKISYSLTRVANGMRTISAHAEAFGGKFSGSLNNISNGMQTISDAAKEGARGFSDITKEATDVETALSGLKIETYFDSETIRNVTESIEETSEAISTATERAEELNAAFEGGRSTVGIPKYDTFDEWAKKVGLSVDDTISKVERLDAIEYSKHLRGVELLMEKYDMLAEKLAVALRKGEDGKAEQIRIVEQMQKLQTQIDKTIASEDGAKQVTASTNTVMAKTPGVIDKIANSFARLETSISKSATNFKKAHLSIGNIVKGMLRIQTFPFSGIAKQLGSIGTRLRGIAKSFMRTARMRAFRYIIRSVTAGIREGIDNAYEWARIMDERVPGFAESMNRVTTSTLYLKNSLGALATPIINAVAPAFDFLIDKVVALLNLLNQLIARLTGAELWTRAVRYAKEYSDSLGAAAGNAGRLAEELITVLGIDELNRMDADRGSGGGSGGGSGSDVDYSLMFVNEQLGEMSGLLADIFEPFKSAWETKGQTVLDGMNYALENIKLLLGDIGGSLKTVWTNGTGQKQIETVLQIFTNINTTIGNISRQLDVAWNFDNLGTDTIQNIADVLTDILEMFERITKATSDWAGELNFVGILQGFKDLTKGIKEFLEPIEDGLAWAWENIMLPLGKWGIEQGLPSTLESVGRALGAIGTILDTIGKSKAGQVLGSIVAAILELAESLISGTWLQLLSDAASLLEGIADIISGKKTIKVVFLEAIEEVLTRLVARFEAVKAAIGAIKDLDLTALEQAISDFINPTNSEWYINVKGEMTDVQLGSNLRIPEVPSEGLVETVGVSNGVRSSRVTLPAEGDVVSATSSKYTKKKGFSLPSIAEISEYIDRFLNPPEIESFAEITNGADFIPFSQMPTVKSSGLITAARDAIEATKTPIVNAIAAATELRAGGGYRNNLQSFPAYATRLDKASGFSNAIQNFVAYATSLLAGSGYSNKIQSFIAYALSLSQGSGYKNNISTFAAYGSSLGAASGYVNKLSTFAAYGSSLGAASGYRNNIQTFPTYATSLNKASGFRGFTVTGYASTGGGGKVSVTLNKNGGIFSNGMWKSIPQYAGGTLNAGSMFIAGEAGPEIVGNVRGRTEVLNQSQIAQAMAQSMQVANSSQNGLLQEQNALLRELINKQGNARAYVTSGDIIDGLTQRNRRDGRTVVAIGV